MALLTRLNNKTAEYIRGYHRIGRLADTVDTWIENTYISKIHAIIEWRDPAWTLRDVSSNGVWLNGDKLKIDRRYKLNVGDVLMFAEQVETSIELSNLAPPIDMLYQRSNMLNTIELKQSTLIPNEANAELGIYKCPDRLAWFGEPLKYFTVADDDEQTELSSYELGPFEHGDKINSHDAQWIFFLNNESTETTEFSPSRTDINDVQFCFDLSLDEESTALTVIHDGSKIDLEERSHHYLIAHLLRFKQQQFESYKSKQANNKALGWKDCELLANELGVDSSHLNILIFRARKQISEHLPGVRGLSRIIERRRKSVRIGIDNFQIYKGGVLEIQNGGAL